MSILLNKVKSNIYYISGNDFEKFAYEALNLIFNGNLQEVKANIEGSGSGDGGVDYYDLNSKTWFSVYGQEGNDEGHTKLKSKIKRDFQKVIDDKPGYKPESWIFVCNRSFGYKHLKQVVSDKNISFSIKNNYDLDFFSKKILETRQGRELLNRYNIIDDFDVYLECKISTEEELNNPNRPNTIENIEKHKNDKNIIDTIEKKLSKDEKEEIELVFDEYLRNYYPLLLDGGKYSSIFPSIEKKYRENINKSGLKIQKGFEDLDIFHDFLVERFDKNKESYYIIDKSQITEKLLLNSEGTKKGCFYNQLGDGFYNICDTEDNIVNLKILKDE